jgi:PEP-CTERM motif
MKFHIKALSSSVLLACVIFSAPALADVVTVAGSSDIFAAGLTPAQIPGSDTSGNVGGNGAAPVAFSVFGGETLQITASGLVQCCVGSTTGSTGPNGFNPNPFTPPGSTISDSIPGGTVGTYTSTNGSAFALLGTFANGNPFTIGADDTITIPVGVNTLYLGFADGSGFQGPSGFYQDNGGALTVNISAVPEPSTWAMMILGFLGVGFMAYRKKCTPRFA